MTKIAITAGHNQRSQGKRRFGTSEYKFWNEFIDDLMPHLKKINGIEVKQFERQYMGRYGYYNEMKDLHGRIDKWGAHIDIELHYNASSSTAKGHEVLHNKNSKGGRIVASLLNNSFNQHLKSKDRGVKPIGVNERGGIGLKIGRSRSIISEAFFSKELNEFMRGGKYRQVLLKAYIEFFKSIPNIDKKTNKVTRQRNHTLTDAEYMLAMEILQGG